LLTGEPDLVELLRDHLDHIDVQLAAIRALRVRLAAMLTAVQAAGPPPATDFLELIEEVMKMDETMQRYFTEEQLATLTRRHEQAGPEATASVLAEWPQLIAAVQVELDAGTDPATAQVQALARRWMELLETFHGGDPDLRDSLYRMQAENSEVLQQQYGGPSPEMIDYIRRANAVAQ
ncbi:MAG: TipAS antibiotic-recognition domain-containing protein, partial [Pseudonocardiaceae bacterium]